MRCAAFLIFCLLCASPARGDAGIREAEHSVDVVYRRLKAATAEHSPDVRVARALAEQKSAQLLTSWARWLPRLDLQLMETRALNNSFLTNGALGTPPFEFTPEETLLSSWTLNLTLPIYKRSVHLALQQSIAERSNANDQLDQRLLELDSRLRSLLGNYLLQAYKDQTIANSLELARTNLREAKLRFELGQKTRIDVLKSEANLSSLESRRITQYDDTRTALSALLEYAGLPEKEFHAMGFAGLIENESQTLRTIEEFARLEGLLRMAGPYLEADEVALDRKLVESSPGYRQLVSDREASEVRARTLMAQEYPELDFQGSLSNQGGHWDEAFSEHHMSHSIGLLLPIPIFSAGSAFTTYYEKKNAQESADVRTERDLLHLRNQVHQEAVQIQAMRKSLESVTATLRANEDIVRLSLKSYQLGKLTITDLLSSQNDLLDAKSAYAKTLLDLAATVSKFGSDLGLSGDST